MSRPKRLPKVLSEEEQSALPDQASGERVSRKSWKTATRSSYPGEACAQAGPACPQNHMVLPRVIRG
jgi:hypothetical protein